MVELTRRERKLVDRLERRLAFLTDKIAACPDRDMSIEVQDRAALLWLMEVAERAAEVNCEEAFTRTSFRNQIVDVALATADYLRRSSRRKLARKQERAALGLPAEKPESGSENEGGRGTG